MAIGSHVQGADLDALRRLDTCMVANAIETFDIRPRNAGFADAHIRCIFEDLPPTVGFAATARLRTVDPPITGGVYRDPAEWWNGIVQVPSPRIIVLEDMDQPPGVGAFLGDVHAAILIALGCIGYVTDGAVRELPRIHDYGLQLFAGSVAVSHAYAHVFDFGARVKIGGLEVRTGDLLHGDRHGLLTVPEKIVTQIPAVAERLQQAEQKVIDFCRSPDFSISRLSQVLKDSG